METKTTPVHPLLVGTTPGPWLQGCRVTGHGIGIHVTTISAGLVASVGDNDARCAGLHKMYASQHYDNDSTRLAVLEANAKLIAAAPSLAAENAALADQVERLRAMVDRAAGLAGLSPWVADPPMKELLLTFCADARDLLSKS